MGESRQWVAPYLFQPSIITRGLLCVIALSASPSAVGAGDISAPNDETPGKATVSFSNDVMPILTKAGCNAGVCHAKAGRGQNGFQLSLLGFEPEEDYEHIVREGRGRRLFPAAPHLSLFLQKATAEVPHGGGARLQVGSEHYQTLLSWIRQGAANDLAEAAKITSLEVVPGEATVAMGQVVPMQVFATFENGERRSVTELALYETNDSSLAEVDHAGVVTAGSLPGKVAVMVRYQGIVGVLNMSIPHGAHVATLPARRNFIDDLAFVNLRELGIPPSALCDDSTFLRRVTLDVAGRLPTLDETNRFLADARPDKREQWIEELLRSPEYADFFANKWTALLKNRRDDASDIKSNFAFFAWFRDGLLANKPYDQIVRELLAATGTVMGNPPVAWYKRVKDPKQQLEDVAQLFLGVRMQCAQCHHHPFERWSQDDYYGLAAFFNQVGRKPTDTRGEEMIFHRRGIATSVNPKTGLAIAPSALGTSMPPIAADEDPRLKLADWMEADENPYFAKALVNRYWKHFFRRGLIEPEDDIRDSNPATNPELLQALEDHFTSSGFDLKELVRAIVNSSLYQLSSEPNEENLADMQNYSRYYPHRLQAEVLLDSIDQLAGTRTDFPNLPPGTRAIALPDNSYNKASPFLRVFGRPENESVCECERVQSSSLAQSLHLMNAGDIKAKLAAPTGNVQRWATAKEPLESRVGELYRLAYSRDPRPEELQTCLEYLNADRTDGAGNVVDEKISSPERFQDLVWAIINTKEFLFNH